MKKLTFLLAMTVVNANADVMPNPYHQAIATEGVHEKTDYINGKKLVQIIVGNELYVTCRVDKGKLIHVSKLRNLNIGYGEKGKLKAGDKPVTSYDAYDFMASALKNLEVGDNYVRHLDTTVRIKAKSTISANRDKYFKKCDALDKRIDPDVMEAEKKEFEYEKKRKLEVEKKIKEKLGKLFS